jgi:hypothetical protein
MKHGTLFSTALALLLGATTQLASAQSQVGSVLSGVSNANGVSGAYLVINGSPVSGCPPMFGVVAPNTPWGLGFPNYGTVGNYYNLNGGNGAKTFVVGLSWFNYVTTGVTPTFQLIVDGDLCTSCSVAVNGHSQGTFFDPNECTTNLTVTHHSGYAFDMPDGAHEFGLRMSLSGTPICDFRFKAVMVGTAFSDLQGYFNAPALPYFILRDPPGGQSFASMSTGSTTCSGFSQSATTGQEEEDYVKAKIGIEGSIGWIIDIPFEIFAEFGVSTTATQSETSELEYETCFETSSEFTSSPDGTPDDMFLGSAIRYAYGAMTTITRTDCNTVVKDAKFASEAVSVLSSYHFTESHIKSTLIPQLTQQIAALTPGTQAYNDKVNQLDVWNQALALNDSIKEEAPFAVTRAFSGGGAGQTYSQTTTTSKKRNIEYTVALEEGLSFDFGAYFGGNGVGLGSSIKMRNEYGSSQGSSNENTNSMSYHLEDGDVWDSHTVNVHKDEVFGSYVFFLDSANSRTSCKYEGGYQLDQPSLSVGSPGNTSMSLTEVPIGTAANFPLVVCNNSDTTRTYYLKFDAATNAQGAVMQAFGNTINSNDDGIQLELLGGQCINTNLALTQPNGSVVDFDNISLRLYSLCEEEYPPYIRSYITISAHYGVGNIGSYCTPVSASGTSHGDYVDGVQLGAINNTGTGGASGPTYTDYTAQFSTPLSRNAQASVTITAGLHPGDHYAAWIDFDHNAVFAANEKLGEFQAQAPNEAQSMPFTVPGNAALGITRMRVRSVADNVGEPMPVEPCFNYADGETEDYAVAIDANTPQDCLGVDNGTALPGTACDDNDANTGNDAWSANCVCAGQVLDCAGVPGGTAVTGTTCDDGNASTSSDAYDANCVCIGLANDCLGTPGGTATPGSSCDDADPTTGADVYNANCICSGQLIDCAGVIGGTTLPGAACNDGNPLSGGDVFDGNCLCAGTFASDCQGVENGPAQPGTDCDDNNASTGADVYGVNCVCAGQPYDCAGTPGGTQTPGTPCDDGNPDSNNDVFTANCGCLGVLPNDCAGVPGGTAQPGTACNDNDAATGNDVYNAFCVCAGLLIDCNGTPGGTALPGFPCDDANANTANDTLSANCQCAGVLIDCEGVIGGGSLTGTACDDGNPDTQNDTWNPNCLCAGTLASDCEGVAGGTAQPGTPCDDGNTATGNDLYTPDCACQGDIIDCAGIPGGIAVPGSPCDDSDACTEGDMYDGACVCAGTALQISAINGPALVYTGTSNAYYVNPVSGATGYSWTLPNGWTSPSTTNFFLQADAGTGVGTFNLCVDANVGACVLTTCLPVQVDLSTGISTSANASEEWFTVQPNPSNSIFSILPADASNGPVRISVHDGIGRNVIAPFILSLERSFPLDMGNVGPGAYYLLATRGDRQQVVKLVVQR